MFWQSHAPLALIRFSWQACGLAEWPQLNQGLPSSATAARRYMDARSILAEGAMTLPVTLSGGVLFAS